MSRTLSSRRMAYIGAVIVIGLTACGAPVDESPSGSAADGPPVIQIDGGQAAGGSSAAPMAAAEDAASSKMMPAYITYVYDGAITDLTAPSASWYFDPLATASTEQVAALAAALGVQGEVRELPADQGGGWMVGPDDYTAPTVNVGVDATQSWWFNPGSASVDVPKCELYPPGDPAADRSEGGGTDAVPAVDPAVDPAVETVPVCEPTPPPTNVPDSATAEAMARDLYAALGIDPDSYEYEVYADEWGANVTGYLVLDGMRTSMATSVGFGAEGAITWASGFMGSPVRGADYPRIGIEAAVQRLNDQSASWMAYDTPVMRGEAVDAGVAVETAVPVAGAATPVADSTAAAEPLVDPAEGVCIDDTGTDCAPAPIDIEPITVTLTNARPSLEQLWASDDTVWLLPGYAFDSADGGLYSVLAVEDQYIEVTPAEEVPAPEPVPVDTVVEGTVVEGTVDPGTVDPGTGAPEVTLNVDEVTTALVGLSVDEAAKVAETNGWVLRVVRIDGVDQAATADLITNRANVATEGGVVTAIVSFG